MYKKTKPRSVMELLNKNLSEREVAAILGCSRNTVSEIKELCRQLSYPELYWHPL